jgi:hypothetical protein
MKRSFLTLVLAAVTIVAARPALAAPLGTAITYHGVLTDAGLPASGAVDLRFRLFDSAAGGTELGLVSVDDVTVTEGRVTATLDFGDQYDGDARWLQVEVRDGASTGAYTVISPRQALLATPAGLYAVDADHAVAADHATTAAATDTLDGQHGNFYRAFANLTGVPPGLGDGDDDTAATLSCAAGEMPTWNGSAWVCDPDDGTLFARTVVVGPVGDAAANGAALLAAFAALPVPPSAEEGILVRLEPGRYDLAGSMLELPPWTTVAGAGEIFTVLTSAVCGTTTSVTATLLGNHDVGLRDLTIENTCASPSGRSRAVFFDWDADSARLSRLTLRTTGAAGGCTALLARSDNAVLDHLTASVSGCAGTATGLETAGANSLLTDCAASASGAAASNGLAIGARSWVSRGTFTANDNAGSLNAGITIDATADIADVNASCADAAVRVVASHAWTVALSRLITGGRVEASDQGGSLILVIEHSRIVASGATVIGDTNTAIGIGMTQLAGAAVSPSGGVIACAGVWDETWSFSANTCP